MKTERAFRKRPAADSEVRAPHLLDPLSLAVLEGGFKDGDHITATLKSGKVVFEKR